jgi:hypothetical protein
MATAARKRKLKSRRVNEEYEQLAKYNERYQRRNFSRSTALGVGQVALLVFVLERYW